MFCERKTLLLPAASFSRLRNSSPGSGVQLGSPAGPAMATRALSSSLLHYNSPGIAAAMDTRTSVALNIGSVISLPSFFVCNSASNGSN